MIILLSRVTEMRLQEWLYFGFSTCDTLQKFTTEGNAFSDNLLVHGNIFL